eukprot:3613047-Pyramimonas_sp.AAC.1
MVKKLKKILPSPIVDLNFFLGAAAKGSENEATLAQVLLAISLVLEKRLGDIGKAGPPKRAETRAPAPPISSDPGSPPLRQP